MQKADIISHGEECVVVPEEPLLLQQGAEDLKELLDEALNVVTAAFEDWEKADLVQEDVKNLQ